MKERTMNGRTHRTRGLTLIEMTLVLATIALMVGLALPAVQTMMRSFQSRGAVQSMVGAALNGARTMAMSKQRYVGVRFQKLCTSDDPTDPLKGLLEASQYMVFIMHDEEKNLGRAQGFRAIEGLEPIKLPDAIGVIDLVQAGSGAVTDPPSVLSAATTFSIVFSPAGRLVVREVQARNRDGQDQPRNVPGSPSVSYDEVFNSVDNVCLYRPGMFLQDDYPALGLGKELSVKGFAIYDAARLRAAYGTPALAPYLAELSAGMLFVNRYTGHLISSD